MSNKGETARPGTTGTDRLCSVDRCQSQADFSHALSAAGGRTAVRRWIHLCSTHYNVLESLSESSFIELYAPRFARPTGRISY